MKKLAILTCLCLCVSLAPGLHAAPLGNQTIQLHYGIYSGGFQALDADVAITLKPAAYDVTMKAKSFGFLGKLLPWAGDHRTTGVIAKGKLVPLIHDKISNWRGDTDHVVLNYAKGVLVKLRKLTIKDGRKTEETLSVDPSYHAGATDTLTAITQMLRSANATGNCNFTQDVFDGKRRFALRFTDEGVENLPESKLNIYHGEARICTIEMVPEKGFENYNKGYYGIQEHARAHGGLPHVWLAPAWPRGPLMPVRILLKSEYGSVFVHLTHVTK